MAKNNTPAKNLYEVVVWHRDPEDHSKDRLIKIGEDDKATFEASTEDEVKVRVHRALPDDLINDLANVEILVKPFRQGF